MSYDDLKQEFGRRPFEWVRLHLEACKLRFGQTNEHGTCPASGEPCFQGWETCKAKSAYAPGPFTVTFCTPVADMPDDLDFIPFLKTARPKAGMPEPMRSLGERGSITFTFLDAPHDDVGIDPYVEQRDYDPLERGTFWPRFRARFPHYQSRLIEWGQGFLSDEGYDEANFKVRTYVIDRLDGWGRRDVQIVAKDPLKLADDNRAQYPSPSRGVLAHEILAESPPSTIDIFTPDPGEYAIEDFEPGYSAVRIGDQCFRYSGVVPITGGVRLTGVTTELGDGYSTEPDDHDVDDGVQKCIWYRQLKAIEIFRILLERGANVPGGFIPYSTWDARYTLWLPGLRLTRLVTEPEGVRSQIDEIIPQSGTWALWWDEVAQQIQYEPVRPADIDEIISEFSDDDNLVENSVSLKDEPNELCNELYYMFGQRDPTKDEDEVGNYRQGFLDIDADSQSPREVGERRSETIYCRWHPIGNRAELMRLSFYVLKTRAKVPFRVEFQVDRKDDDAKTGQFVDLTSTYIVDRFGLPRTTRVRLIQATSSGDKVSFTAREDFFRARIGRIAPGALSGLSYADASEAQRGRYIFIANASGLMSDGTEGYKLL